jgi:hypothetical protein
LLLKAAHKSWMLQLRLPPHTTLLLPPLLPPPLWALLPPQLLQEPRLPSLLTP